MNHQYSRMANMQLNVCADDMASLRKCDVYRLAELCINQSEKIHNEMKQWISNERPELLDEYNQCSDEILTERVWKLQNETHADRWQDYR